MSESSGTNDWEVAGRGSGESDWPWRPLVLALVGLATGVAAHLLVSGQLDSVDHFSALRLSALTMLVVAAGLFGFTVERRDWLASVIFALVAAAAAAGIVYWNGPPKGWGGGDGWRMLILLLGLAIAAPLFQAARGADPEGPRLPYAAVHDHAWTNVVLWFACWVFVGIVFALMWLLASLFGLIELHFLRRLLEQQWFGLSLIGLSFGAALGLLREHDAVTRLLHRVVASVLAVLAPVLGVGLALFLLFLPFTGLGPLWKAWVSTTPLLLVCVVGALVLANAVIGNARDQESRLAIFRIGAMLLAVVMLPLAVLAAIATGLRIGQYGFTPERLWALTFIVIATAYGLAYFVSLVRGWREWTVFVRPANLNLAMGLCLLALLLSTPLVSFNAISTRDQVARLESGKVTPDKFDWAALAYDFGAPGKAALAQLQASKNAAVAKRAAEVAKSKDRWEVRNDDRQAENRAKAVASMRALPAGTVLPEALRSAVASSYICFGTSGCTVVLLPGGKEALLLNDSCYEAPPAPPPAKPGSPQVAIAVPAPSASGTCEVTRYALEGDRWITGRYAPSVQQDGAKRDAAYKAGKIEVRTVQRRQAFVGDVPVGEAFE
jgi:hypothetical protein